MRNAALILERFDTPRAKPTDGFRREADLRTDRVRNEAFSEGYAAGQAAANAQSRSEGEALAAAAAAIELELCSAHEKMTNSVAQSLKILVEALLPELARKGFAAETAAALSAIAAKTEKSHFELRTSPENTSLLEERLKACASGGKVTVVADETLSSLAAEASWETGGVSFNLDDALAACLNALERSINEIASESKP